MSHAGSYVSYKNRNPLNKFCIHLISDWRGLNRIYIPIKYVFFSFFVVVLQQLLEDVLCGLKEAYRLQ